MEYKDKLQRQKKQSMLGFVVIFILVLLFIYYNDVKETNYVSKSIYNIFYSLIECMIIFQIIFEFIRPDFIINEKEIIFSNQPIWSLLSKKKFQYRVSLNNINNLNILPEKIIFNIKNGMKTLSVKKFQFDNYTLLTQTLIKIIDNNHIPIYPRDYTQTPMH